MDLRVLRVVVASPGDVKPERDTVSKVVEEVNRTIGRERRLTLDVYRWETDSHPGFHPQGPQGLIDPTLKIEDCDLLIGIFWRRFGTPVSDAKSGTEHEFRLAYKAWEKNQKPQIMVYFSQKPYAPKSKEETDQWGLVLQFKKDFPKEGLWWDYKNKPEFETFLRNHLTQFLQAQSPIKSKTEKKQPETSPLTPLFQLPPPPADFTGRTAELAELRAAIEKGGVHISGLQGQGGVGKTALALKLAAELASNYPDAQIYLDLKGVSEKPLTAAEAMSHVLRTFHPEAKLPEKEEDLRALYLSAVHNKRALLLMDNAKNAAEVKPLIPPPSCALLVTSRQHFALPGLQAKNLETLPPQDAKELLLRITPRIDGEAETIAKLCGYLPQALRLAASAMTVRVNLEPQDYARQLADEKRRLELLAGEDESVTASITLSYDLLDSETQKRWRMLAVFPDTFDAHAAAAVWEIEADAAQDALSSLLQYSMLEWNDSTKRYRLHDLMRDFARQRLTPAESDAASKSHATHYGTVLEAADEFYLAGGDSIVSGLALFDIEWGNIQAGQAWAAAQSTKNHEAAELCSGYPRWGTYVLLLRQQPRGQIRWREAGLAAARQLKDQAAEGSHLGNLGIAYRQLGEYNHAIECHEQHLAFAREAANREGEGNALANLGLVHAEIGDQRRAIEYYEQALATYREIGDRRGEGSALGNLAVAHRHLGDSRRAVGYGEEALVALREIGDRLNEGVALGNLGSAYARLGETQRAIDYYEQRIVIAREIGDRRGEGSALSNMSGAIYDLGDRKKAIEHAEAGLKIFEEIEHPKAAKLREQLDIWRNS
jgi:tetratricopeptide (TPR) repeat protein